MYYHRMLVDKGTKDAYSKLPISPKIARIKIVYWIFFKLPVLIILLSILGYFPKNKFVSWSICITLVVVLWNLIGRMIYDLLYQGANRYLTSINSPTLALMPKPSLNKKQQVRSFTLSLFSLVILIIIGYSAIYFICNYQLDGKAYTGIPSKDNAFNFIYFLYFSVVTFATVGYGDIIPAPIDLNNHPICNILPRVFVSSEICLSFTIIAVFIASFSLTFSYETESSKENESD